MENVILASSSPRRRMLLEQLGIKFKVVPANIEEDKYYSSCVDCIDLVENLARVKALDIARNIDYTCVVIGADTLVVKDCILSKPRNADEAADMLTRLSGAWHEVFTGFCVASAPSMNILTGHECTRVKFRDISEQEIRAYIATGEPMDKAAAYAAQGIGSVFIERIEGCYFNVIGLPIYKVAAALKCFGVSVL